MNSTDVIKYIKDNHPEFKITYTIDKNYLIVDNNDSDFTVAYLLRESFRFYVVVLSIDYIETRPHFLGNYEDWDIDIIKKLIEDYYESKRKAELYLKLYKANKLKNRIKKDFE